MSSSSSLHVLPGLRCGAALFPNADHSPPSSVFSVTHKTIGGIGRTLRWRFRSTEHADTAAVDVLLSHIACTRERLDALLEDLTPDVVVRVGEYEECGEDEEDEALGLCAVLRVLNARNMTLVLVHLASVTTFEYVVEDETREHVFDVGIERFDRSHWNFFKQDSSLAAPKQSWHKWSMSWIPDTWSVLPFTWSRLAHNLDHLAIRDAPLPLRHHLVRHRAERAEAELAARGRADARRCDDSRPNASARTQRADPTLVLRARARSLRASLPATRCVTAALTEAQQRELLRALVTVRYPTPSGEEERARAERVLHSYMMNGYTARVFGPYKQDARHVGHGVTLRRFRRLTQYDPSNLPTEVLNETYQPDGTLRGRAAPREDGGARTRKRARETKPRKRRANNDVVYYSTLRAEPRFEPAEDDMEKTSASTSPVSSKRMPASIWRAGL